MIYLIWMQDYDYCGATLVEGPDGIDMGSLRKEYSDLCRAAYDAHAVARHKAFAEERPEPPIPEFLEMFNRWKEVDRIPFQDSATYSFACWLVEAKNLGLKHVVAERVEY